MEPFVFEDIEMPFTEKEIISHTEFTLHDSHIVSIHEYKKLHDYTRFAILVFIDATVMSMSLSLLPMEAMHEIITLSHTPLYKPQEDPVSA